MKIAHPVSVAPRSHKDDDYFLPRPGFTEDLRREVKAMAKAGFPVTMRGGKLFYRNKKEGVAFAAVIADLEVINQGRSHWVRDAFEVQIGVERILKMASSLELENVGQNDRGLLHWRWHGRDLDVYRDRWGSLGLRIFDGESIRHDLFKLEEILNPDLLLQCMQRSDRALSAQLKLKDFFDRKNVLTRPFPNGLDFGRVRIHVKLDDVYAHSDHMDTALGEETADRILGYLAEFKASERARLKEESLPVPLTLDDLDLI